jgi:hypothetical protein
MRRDDFVDFVTVADSHLGIHERLTNWARWVAVRPHGWQVAPMFRQYRSHAWQWHERIIQTPVNVPEAVEMEKAVSQLPEKHREAIRWHYVFNDSPVRIARRLAVTKQGLADLVGSARSMLINRGV